MLIIEDPDAPDPKASKMVWVHWVVYNIPPNAKSLPENLGKARLPQGASFGLNDFKKTEYGGPCPPIGRHRYFHKLHALDITLDLRGPTKSQIEQRGKARQGKARQGKARQGKARQGKARQGKARQGKARQGKARQGKARQGKARQGKARQGKARQGKARQGKARQGKARQGKARQGKARQGKARQGKARQGKARPCARQRGAYRHLSKR